MQALTGIAARILYGLPMIVFGLNHFMKAGQMSGMVPGFIPGGAFWVYLTGAALIAAGLAIISGKMAQLAGVLLALMLIVFVLTIHLPGVLGGGEGSQMAMISLLKDTALAGGALLAGRVAGAVSRTKASGSEATEGQRHAA